MRYIIIGILFYVLYLLIKYILSYFLKSRKFISRDLPKNGRKSKLDPNEIEDADYEEIKD
ncbi:MAG: hypothetical protein ACRDFC_04445 [Ignavibacteria bacterium]